MADGSGMGMDLVYKEEDVPVTPSPRTSTYVEGAHQGVEEGMGKVCYVYDAGYKFGSRQS